MTSGGRAYVLLDRGWLEVSAAAYPAGLPFTALPGGAAAGIPIVGTVGGPHFIRERSDAQTYLVSYGTLQPVSSAEQAWVTAKYGVSSQVWVVLDGTIGGTAAPEGLVRTAAGTAYLLDGQRAYRLRDCGQVADWGGDCATLPTDHGCEARRATRTAGVLQYLVQTPPGPRGFRRVASVDRCSIRASWRSMASLPRRALISTATAAKLSVGEPALAAGSTPTARMRASRSRRVGSTPLTPEQTVGVVRTSARALTAASLREDHHRRGAPLEDAQ